MTPERSVRLIVFFCFSHLVVLITSLVLNNFLFFVE